MLYGEKNSSYLPFYIARKETKDGYNISKQSLEVLNDKLDNIFEDLQTGAYEILYLKD